MNTVLAVWYLLDYWSNNSVQFGLGAITSCHLEKSINPPPIYNVQRLLNASKQ